ncbi:MAG TPA: anthranilate synthase component I [bacterium]|nr:anthranilate synthase component I [bacterium]
MKSVISSNVVPSFESFREFAKTYNRIPVSLAFQSDLETPLSAYLKLAQRENGFLLESVEKNEQVARFSIVGFEPTAVYEAKNGSLTHQAGKKRTVRKDPNPLQVIQKEVASIRQAPLEGAQGFLGGLVGFVGYDAVRYFEKLPSQKPDLLDLPDLFLMVTDQLALFDHLKRTLRLVVNVEIGPKTDLAKAYKAAVKRLAVLSQKMEKPLKGVGEIPVGPVTKPGPNDLFGFSSNMTQADFRGMVERSKEYIKAGDIIQVVGSQRFEKAVATDAVTIYRILRRLNPSPYMFILKAGGVELVGSSPEMMIKVQNGVVETRPIAGSRPRGRTPEEDKQLEESLLADQKEIAEHVMLVDLARNDLGRVCDFGSVQVGHFKRVERYSHVMHIVSDVTGRLQKGRTAYDAFQSCFPAGTLSGAPKIRAMEIIEELEPSRRGLYGGAVCAFGFDGNMDSAITIRSVVLKRTARSTASTGSPHARAARSERTMAYVQAGAGLVADSVAESEYMESCNKARAVLMAVGQAETTKPNSVHQRDTEIQRKNSLKKGERKKGKARSTPSGRSGPNAKHKRVRGVRS